MNDIDPIQYGQLIAKVEMLESQVSEMSNDIKSLLAMANKSKGGLWVGMTLASLFGGLIHFLGEKFLK
jgi:hypothetical protein